MVFFCSEDAHIPNKQRGQLLTVRNNLFPAPSETETKGVLGKKIILHKCYRLFYKQKALLVLWCVSLCERLLQNRRDSWTRALSRRFGATRFRARLLPKESPGMPSSGCWARWCSLEGSLRAIARENCHHLGALQQLLSSAFGKTACVPAHSHAGGSGSPSLDTSGTKPKSSLCPHLSSAPRSRSGEKVHV